MNEQILINVTPQETRVAVTEQGAVQELHIERDSSRGLVGNVYLGRVCRVLPACSRRSSRSASRARHSCTSPTSGPPATAMATAAPGEADREDPFRGPDARRAGGEGSDRQQGARLSTQVSIAGRLLVYLPQDPHIGISQRIEDEVEREHLRERVHALIPPGEAGGFIVRTVAEQATDAELTADIEYLVTLWKQIQQSATTAAPQELLYQDLSLATRVLRDLVTDSTERIIVDSRETFQKLRDFAERYTHQALPILEHYSGERPLFDLFAVEDEIERALARRVDLKSGGYLIIDQTEALTTVDVNTGGFVSGRSFDDTIFKTNLEAAQAIARQLRLRNLGGIIIVDFIDMDSIEHREAVLAEFRKTLSRDRTRVTVNGFSQLGLVEMTRKRTRESLAHVLCEPCPVCDGRGELKTPQTICYEILREILRADRQFSAKEYRILAAQKVIDLFLDEESGSLAELGDFIKKPISMQVETAYMQEQYDVILV
jgi:ribonuclease G